MGTHFNVNAYDDESEVKVTLLEGSVNVSIANGQSLKLKPGQQAQAAGDLKVVHNIDPEQVIAWKNGLLAFNNADIKTIMRELQRWYDVDVQYNGNMPGGTFSGDIQRTASLSEILKLFQVSKIHFSIDAENKKLTVMP
jgi:ferric-dicitrate binding protein FerR (iron transport regulator)